MSSGIYPSGATVALAPDATTEEWHAVRGTGIGGSDIAAICGLNSWTSPLEIWLRKTGRPVPERGDAKLSEAALMGHLLEPIVAHRFTDLTDLPVYDHPGTLRHGTTDWLMANLDRITVEDGQPGVLELKTRSSYALADWETEPPVDVQVQVQWQLAVTGWQFGHTACLIGGQRTVVHRVDRDEQMIADLLAIGGEFWQQVQDGVQPPVDASAATGALLDRLYPAPTDDVVVGDAAAVEDLLRRRAHAKEAAAGADIALTEVDNQLKALCGDATEVHIRGERAYSWPRYSRKGSVDWSALREDHPEINPDDYRKPSTTYRTLRVHLEDL